MNEEDFTLQMRDAYIIQEFADWLRAEALERHQKGGLGDIESAKVKEAARQAVRVAAEYL